MNGTKIHQEKSKVKYVYDYPANREVSEHLNFDDKQVISNRTGFSIRYVRQWCQGKRRSRPIEEWARMLMRLNIAKQRKLNRQPNTSTN